jgi:hypothetical protein
MPKVVIPIEIDSGEKPENWIMFTVPFDRTCQTEMVSWAESESYNLRQAKETLKKRETYFSSLIPKNTVQPFEKKDFTVYLRFIEGMEQEGDQAFVDVKNCIAQPLHMANYLNLRVDLLFDTEADPRLAQDEFVAVTANLVQAVIMMLQEGQEDDVKRKVQELDAEESDLTMSGALPEDDEVDPDVIKVRDFVRQESGGQVRRTMYGNSDAEVYDELERRGRSRTSAPERHYYMGDERDDVIMPASTTR